MRLDRAIVPRYTDYTSLTASINHIYAVSSDQTPFRKPDPIKLEKSKRDASKYCQFHREIGHDTSRCYALKNEIEDLIRKGYLKNFVKDTRGYQKRDQTLQSEEGPEVQMIYGGPSVAGELNRSRNRYAREARSAPLTNVLHLEERPPKSSRKEGEDIIFIETDARWVHHPHHDALVIIAKVGNSNVHRILVDNRSAVNKLYLNAFQTMGLTDRDLKPATTPLYDFRGDSLIPRGRIALAVTMGEKPPTSTVMTDFLVVSEPSSYNALFGRSMLKDMKAITSIYHLGVKFPTAEGTGYV